jgi:hypothetical protein
VNSSYRCEFFIFKFVCAPWRDCPYYVLRERSCAKKVAGTSIVGLLHHVEKIERILLT